VNRSGEGEEGEDPKQDTNEDPIHGEEDGMGGSGFGIGNDNDNEENNGNEYENISVTPVNPSLEFSKMNSNLKKRNNLWL